MSYGFKLACLSFAAFFLVHAAAALLAGWFAPVAIRFAARMRAQAAARFLLTLRLAPPAIALFVVAALCVPSYLWFEPDVAAEQVGPACLVAAILCVAAWTISLTRAARAWLSSRRVEGLTIALVGALRPRLIVSSKVRRVLSAQELDVALRHERAHAQSYDNFKRLLMLLSPDVFPFFRGRFSSIEQSWKRFAEWAADDRAVGGDGERSVALASALVRVARLGSATPGAPLVTTLVDDHLTIRVDRLLHGTPKPAADRWTPAAFAVAALVVVALKLTGLSPVYDLLERLIGNVR